jgi:hypothetical protein
MRTRRETPATMTYEKPAPALLVITQPGVAAARPQRPRNEANCLTGRSSRDMRKTAAAEARTAAGTKE